MDWTASGIEHAWEYELVDNVRLDLSLGWITEHVAGGRLTHDRESEYRASATLEVTGAFEMPPNAAVRIWHVSRLLGEEVREEMATLMPEPEDSEGMWGAWHGTYTLHSTLKRLDDDLLPYDVGLADGSYMGDRFEAFVSNGGGTPAVDPAIGRGWPTRGANVFACGDSVLSACTTIAGWMGARVDADAHGRVTLAYSVEPSRAEPTFAVPTGEASLTLPGVTRRAADIVNKAVCAATVDDVAYFACATLPDDHPWSFKRLGYWRSKSVPAPSVEDGGDVQAALDAAVEQRLSRDTYRAGRGLYGATMLYHPDVRVGAAGRFVYDDGGTEVDIAAYVLQREVELDESSRMEITFMEV